MYESAKHIIKTILPEEFLNKQETSMRKTLALFYTGNKYQCNLCGKKLRKFITLKSNDLMCPNCGSLPRTRGLWSILQADLSNKRILHFSPTPAIRRSIQQMSNKKKYVTADFENEFAADIKLNIESLDLESGTFDIIICYHVLEHVQQDIKALEELFRVLASGGVAYIQTPFKEGDIYENYSITEPSDRLRHFGQEDHVRVYSPEGLMERMNTVGFHTELITKNNSVDNYNGLKEKEIVLKGRKLD